MQFVLSGTGIALRWHAERLAAASLPIAGVDQSLTPASAWHAAVS